MKKLTSKCSFCKKVTYSLIAASLVSVGMLLTVVHIWAFAFIFVWSGVIAAFYGFDKFNTNDLKILQKKFKKVTSR